MRIATFNIENLDDAPIAPEDQHRDASFEQRAPILGAQLKRLKADILCVQEVHGQDIDGEPRQLRALKTLLQGTQYENYKIHSTTLKNKPDVERFHNLVTLINPAYDFQSESREILNEFVDKPAYKFATGSEAGQTVDVGWNRPILYSVVDLPSGATIHVINAHFKSKRPTPVDGEGPTNFKWKSAAGWAEGFFISSMKRVGQALETRIFVDQIISDDPDAKIVICGDINADTDEVPMQTLRGETADTGNSKLNSRVLYPLEHTVPEEARFTLFHHGQKNLLDHLLVSESLLSAYQTTEIHNEIVRDETIAFAVDVKHPSSDHAPIVAAFDDSLIT